MQDFDFAKSSRIFSNLITYAQILHQFCLSFAQIEPNLPNLINFVQIIFGRGSGYIFCIPRSYGTAYLQAGS